jgi:hypothetical protein
LITARYLPAAALLGLLLSASALLFRLSRTDIRARLLLKAGTAYLPCLLLVLLLDRFF